MKRSARRQQGSALLAVLWLSAALSAIAFSVAATVRSEQERTSTVSEGARAYYLATGAVERGILWIQWGMINGYRNPDGSAMYYQPPMPLMRFSFPTGTAVVEVVPEAGKLNVNNATPAELVRLLMVQGIDSNRAQTIAAGIVDWRSGGGPAALNFTPGSSFQPPHASLEELEEILLIPGMTPDIFYGRYDHDPSGRLIPRGGLRDCLTVFGANTRIDINTAPGTLLEAAGIDPQTVRAILARRLSRPFKSVEEIASLVPDVGIQAKLGVGGNSIWTLRATARLRSPNGQPSDLRKTVGAVVKFLDPAKFDPPYHILRWYDDAWTPAAQAF